MRKALVELEGSALSVRRRCELLGVNRNRLEGRRRVADTRLSAGSLFVSQPLEPAGPD